MSSNEFKVKKIEKQDVTVEEAFEKTYRHLLFLGKYGSIVYVILLFMSVFVFAVGTYLSLSSIYDNSTRIYEIDATVEFNGSSHINLDSAYPISDEDAIKNYEDENNKDFIPSVFTINNASGYKVKYIVAIADLSVNNSDHLRTEIINTRISNGNNVSQFKLNSNPLSIPVTTTVNNEEVNIVPDNSYVLATGELNSNQDITYTLMMWIDDNDTVNSDQNKKFEGKVNIYFEMVE